MERDQETFEATQALILSRHNVLPKRLAAPGPDTAQLNALLALAAAAPDHGMITPWRFILVPAGKRARLADAFVAALLDRDYEASAIDIERAREKAHRAPVLLIAIAHLGRREPDTPPFERLVSMGAAIQNLLLGAHAMGFGAGLTSGRAMTSTRLRVLCRLRDDETAVCCISIGTVTQRKPSSRVHPGPDDILSVLDD
jgi:nitroreductase